MVKNTISPSFGWRNFSLGQKFASIQILISVVLLAAFFGYLSLCNEWFY